MDTVPFSLCLVSSVSPAFGLAPMDPLHLASVRVLTRSAFASELYWHPKLLQLLELVLGRGTSNVAQAVVVHALHMVAQHNECVDWHHVWLGVFVLPSAPNWHMQRSRG